MNQKKEKSILQKLILHSSQLNVAITHGIFLNKTKYAHFLNWQHIQRLKINILGANW